MLSEFIARWNLVPAGEPFRTNSSVLALVIWRDLAAMLKIPFLTEEKRGARLMERWDGEGAAKVFARRDGVLLIERATGDWS